MLFIYGMPLYHFVVLNSFANLSQGYKYYQQKNDTQYPIYRN